MVSGTYIICKPIYFFVQIRGVDMKDKSAVIATVRQEHEADGKSGDDAEAEAEEIMKKIDDIGEKITTVS